MAGEPEEPLTGGRVTAGVVRVGDTVRRPMPFNADLVHPLLRHLARVGFAAAPAFLGKDEKGREVLSYIHGDVPHDLGFHGDESLWAAARLVRAFHDHSAVFVSAEELGTEIVCHNDLSPCNFVFRAGLPAAIIDFDAAAPGTRVEDLGYAAWLWLDIGSADFAPAEQARRLGIFLEAYGWNDRTGLISAMQARQTALAQSGGDAAMVTWAAACLAWTRANEGLLNAA